MSQPKKIGILGSTGSIGTQTLEVLEHLAPHFQAVLLTAANNAELLISQAKKFLPKVVHISNIKHYEKVKNALSGLPINVFAGDETTLCQAIEACQAETLVTALVGYAGLIPTLHAISLGMDIALANKETLVVAGELVKQAVKQKGVRLLPVDSEHAAIFQCLEHNPIEKIYLTASGGPFRGMKKEQLKQVSKQQALKHPNWAMGAKITIDSATLMNKGLEVIEAKWLFDLTAQQIEVVVHPQSIIHSMVCFRDGSIKAQLGLPDMKLPIQYALTHPNRMPNRFPRFDFLQYPTFTFEQPDKETFDNLALAFFALEKGGNTACVLNAANEVSVQAFLEERISFLEIAQYNRWAVENTTYISTPTLQDYVDTDLLVRQKVNEKIGKQ